MKKLFISLAALLLLSSNCFAQTVSFDWAKRFGSYNADFGYFTCADEQGNVVTIGRFRDTVDFDPGLGVYNLVAGTAQNVFISKHDASGKFKWAKTLAINNDFDFLSGTTDKQGNVLIAGTFRIEMDFDPGAGVHILKPNPTATVPIDGYLLKLDSNGNFAWVCHLNSITKTGVKPSAVGTDANNNIYIGGATDTCNIITSKGTTVFSPPTRNSSFIIKFDADGGLQYAKPTGEIKTELFAVDKEKNIWVCGDFDKTLDFDPGPAVYNMTPTTTASDFYIVKLDSSANFLWAKQIGGKRWDATYANPSIDKWGNAYFVGTFMDSVDFDPSPLSEAYLYQYSIYNDPTAYILCLNRNGDFRWVRSFGNRSIVMTTTVDTFGNVYVGGSFGDSALLSPVLGGGTIKLKTIARDEIFISMLDSKGNFIWAKQAYSNSLNYSQITRLSINSKGDLYATGYFQNSDFNPGGADSELLKMLDTAKFGFDIFLWKMTVSGLHSSNIKSKNPSLANYLKIYPNPATEIINIEGLFIGSIVSLYNMLGQEVAQQTNNSNVAQISMRGLASGMYLVQIKDANGNMYNAKIIKE